jgi:hypothetical protein
MKLVRILMMVLAATLISMHPSVNAQQNDVVLVEPGPISYPGNQPYTLNEVRKAILTAAMRHEWRVESDSPGTIRIILDGRTDRAVLIMDVVYDEKSYSIKYVSSENLRYSKGKKATISNSGKTAGSYVAQSDAPIPTTIHPSYARWMKNLTNAIDVELRIAKL